MLIVTNLYPGHFHHVPFKVSLERAGMQVESLVEGERDEVLFDGPADGIFIFNYPMGARLASDILARVARGEPLVVFMDDPLAFFDPNINRVIIPILHAARRVYTSSDNMLPIYRRIGVRAELLVGLANPLFDDPRPVEESEMVYDWGFVGTLIPQRFRFFWELQQRIGDLSHYFVTEGFGPDQVRERVRQTRCNIAYGNFSDITDFKARGSTLRNWEFPYCGGFLLQDRRPLLHRFFVEGESMVTFRTVAECARLIRHYRQEPEARRRIATAARGVIDQHRMVDFFPTLFRELAHP